MYVCMDKQGKLTFWDYGQNTRTMNKNPVGELLQSGNKGNYKIKRSKISCR